VRFTSYASAALAAFRRCHVSLSGLADVVAAVEATEPFRRCADAAVVRATHAARATARATARDGARAAASGATRDGARADTEAAAGKGSGGGGVGTSGEKGGPGGSSHGQSGPSSGRRSGGGSAVLPDPCGPGLGARCCGRLLYGVAVARREVLGFGNLSCFGAANSGNFDAASSGSNATSPVAADSAGSGKAAGWWHGGLLASPAPPAWMRALDLDGGDHDGFIDGSIYGDGNDDDDDDDDDDAIEVKDGDVGGSSAVAAGVRAVEAAWAWATAWGGEAWRLAAGRGGANALCQAKAGWARAARLAADARARA